MIRTSTLAAEGKLLVSKWWDLFILLDINEMQNLLEHLAPVAFYVTDRLVELKESCLSKEEFLDGYADYVHALQRGELLPEERMRKLFQVALSNTEETFYVIEVTGDTRVIVKAKLPVIQVQPHRMDYSKTDGKFRSTIFSREYISWGLHFSYPQFYQDPKTFCLEKIGEVEKFPNTSLFHSLRRWVRSNTLPTPFLVEGKKIVTPIRTGKSGFSWAAHHPQLKTRGIEICK